MSRSERLAWQGFVDTPWGTATVIKDCNEISYLRYHSTEHCLYDGREVEADIYEDLMSEAAVFYAVIC